MCVLAARTAPRLLRRPYWKCRPLHAFHRSPAGSCATSTHHSMARHTPPAGGLWGPAQAAETRHGPWPWFWWLARPQCLAPSCCWFCPRKSGGSQAAPPQAITECLQPCFLPRASWWGPPPCQLQVPTTTRPSRKTSPSPAAVHHAHPCYASCNRRLSEATGSYPIITTMAHRFSRWIACVGNLSGGLSGVEQFPSVGIRNLGCKK